MIVFIGLPLLVVCTIFWFVMVILATIRAVDDKDPGYMLSISFPKQGGRALARQRGRRASKCVEFVEPGAVIAVLHPRGP